MQIMDFGKNLIIYGPQGSGKTKKAEELAFGKTLWIDAGSVCRLDKSILADLDDMHRTIIVDCILPENLIDYISILHKQPQQIILIVQSY